MLDFFFITTPTKSYEIMRVFKPLIWPDHRNQARLLYAISRIDTLSLQNRYRIVESILVSIQPSLQGHLVLKITPIKNQLSKNLSRIPVLFQCLRHSLSLIVSVSICPLSHVTVRRAFKKTRSGASFIGGIKRILIAISASLG